METYILTPGQIGVTLHLESAELGANYQHRVYDKRHVSRDSARDSWACTSVVRITGNVYEGQGMRCEGQGRVVGIIT